MNGSVEIASVPRDAGSVVHGLAQLTKPGVTRMVVMTTLAGAVIAPGRPAPGKLLLTLLATAAVVGAANALNMYLERDIDGQMERTRTRPLPSGRLSPEVALRFGVALALSGLTLLSFAVNAASGLLCAVAFLSYVLVYTPLKRVTPFALHVGAIPGAIPPLIGWVSVTGTLSPAAFSLFAILLVWQLPHFLAIAIFREREYARAGLAVYTAVRGIPAAKRAIVGYSLLLALVSLSPVALGLGTPIYLTAALALGLVQVGAALFGLVHRGSVERWARGLFFASLPYLLVVFGCLAVTAP